MNNANIINMKAINTFTMNDVNIINVLASEMGAVILSIAISFVSLHIAFIVLALSIFFTMFMLKEWFKSSKDVSDSSKGWMALQGDINKLTAKEIISINKSINNLYQEVDTMTSLITQRKDMVNLNNRKN